MKLLDGCRDMASLNRPERERGRAGIGNQELGTQRLPDRLQHLMNGEHTGNKWNSLNEKHRVHKEAYHPGFALTAVNELK
jgi:hypothetical protein